ncbi:MupA/Atu3671 family FMN-dependent luciferase-like monooxygenase [Nocardia sp. NPDC005978]|uniref:type I polyketide synthase n=1 Tax=Nocardia sp. NPDC005978 TaxID=3156725 RepID=UPI0033B35BA4
MNLGGAIAVVGMAGRFPGAADVGQLWSNLLLGKESIARPDPGDPPALTGPFGVLSDIELFDAGFFGFSPAEAEMLDPQHRLFLETAWHALENGACPPHRFGAQTGVFASSSTTTYLLGPLLPRFVTANSTEKHRMMLATDKDFLATRTCYKLDLRGPGINVQTGCSSSLVAVHMAARSLAAGDCGVAVVGAASITVPQGFPVEHVEGAILSADGYCRPFDAAASGTVGGNGVAAVVLRRAEDAVRDGNPIRALILGSAVANDGRLKVGYTAPGWEGQVRTVSAALRQAGVSGADIGFVEAHGTGTLIGDPIEVSALAEAIRLHREGPAVGRSCLLGSIKANIGHLDAAAGVAGLIKAVLCVETGIVPGTVNFTRPNPNVAWDRTPFMVNSDSIEWTKSPRQRVCGVNALGIGGTNAHVVVSGWNARPRSGTAHRTHMVTLSAHSPAAVAARTRDLRQILIEDPEVDSQDLAGSSRTSDGSLPYRRVVIADSRANLIQALVDTPAPGTMIPAQNSAGVGFLFPGQGAGYRAVAWGLRAEFDEFRREHDECLAMLSEACSQPVAALLDPEGMTSEQTLTAQPALFAVEVALARFFARVGITPACLLGHSLGEYAAATLSGVMSLEDACGVVAARARAMHEMPAGVMLAAAIRERDVAEFLEPGADLAAVNSSGSCVLSGPIQVMAVVEQKLAANGTAFRRLAVSRAFHSSMLDEQLGALGEAYSKARLHPPQIPFVSNLTGTWITDEQALSPQYWGQQSRGTVRFHDGLSTMLKSSIDLLVEVGPGHGLARLATRHPDKPENLCVVSAMTSAREAEVTDFCRAVGAGWAAGVNIDWAALWPHSGPQLLPAYPFQRDRFWPTSQPEPTTAPGPAAGNPAAPKPLSRSESALSPTSGPFLNAVRRTYTEVIGASVADSANFFEVGGDSLSAVQAVLGLRNEIDCPLSLRDFVDNPSVAQLVDLLSSRLAVTNGPDHSEITSCGAARSRATDSECSTVFATKGAPNSTTRATGANLQMSLFFLASASASEDRYALIRECARTADELGYTALWMPERHFHRFGELHPNPAVLAAGLATITRRIHLRSGSIVAPLHHPARIAEEWAVVDNLSNGRVGLGFAPGFQPIDFVFNQTGYRDKQAITLEHIEKVRDLWRGRSVADVNGVGERVRLTTYPRPIQPELPIWMTASANPETFALAGRSGTNVLTALIHLDMDKLRDRIATYRAARAEVGLDPTTGVVTVMLHAYLGEGDDDAVRAVVEQPLRAYLWSQKEVIDSAARYLIGDIDLDELSTDDRDTLIDFAFDRYYGSRSLVGTEASFSARTQQLRDIGVDEIACLVDFGLDSSTIVAGLKRIANAATLASAR